MMPHGPFAHSSNSAGEFEPLAHHLDKTAKLCATFLSSVKQANTGQLLGILHDIGKEDAIFQEVLIGKRQHVNHALAGAAFILCQFRSAQRIARLLATVIACHHGELDSLAINKAEQILSTGIGKDQDNRDIALGDTARLKEALNWLQHTLPGMICKPNKPPLDASSEDRFRDNLSEMLLTRILYSGLVDADWSATASFYEPDYTSKHTGIALDAEKALSGLIALRDEKRRAARQSDDTITSLNQLRDALFDRCLKVGECAPGLYTLTAPTGMGKTLALMAFALRHCQRHGKRRVIVLLPWLTIAEQNTSEYQKIFKEEGELIEVHSAANQAKQGKEPEDEDLLKRVRSLSERWNAPCIITTVVSFFEPLFSAQPRDCRHLHQIANSVIILDEAQSLPHELLHSTLLTLLELKNKYGCTILLSTATQPAYAHMPEMRDIWTPTEIAPNPQEMVNQTRRVFYRWRIGDEAISRESLMSMILETNQALLIVNTRGVAQSVYGELHEMRKNDVFLLSADLCMAHRHRVLKTVRERLAHNLPCLLVSTSCIEAGVDISFPVLFRQLAPMESIIQAAGRCNRNGLAQDGHVTVFEFTDSCDNRYPGAHYENCAKAVKAMVAEDPGLNLYDLGQIDAYYQRIFRAKRDIRDLEDSIKLLDYAGVQRTYRMIEEYGVDLIVPYDKEVFIRLRDKADAEGLTPALIRQARAYAVNVPLKLVEDVACPVPVKNQTRTYGTGWYILGDSSRYDAKDGFGLLRQRGKEDRQDFLFG